MSMRLSRRARRAAVVVATALVGMSLWASPAAAADPAHDPTVYCAANSRVASAVAFAGYAQAPTHSTPPIALRVKCTYISSAGTYVADTTTPGYVVTTAGSGLVGTGPVTVCEEAEALYLDGHIGRVPERCNNVAIPVDPPDGEIDDVQTAQCQHTRQSQSKRWFITAVGVAPVKTVPATSIAVSCWLVDANGTWPVSSTTPGAVGVVAGLSEMGDAIDIAQRCVRVHAVYLDLTTETFQHCQVF